MSGSNSTVEYRDIQGFPGYRVGDDGSVWSCKLGAWRRRTPFLNHNGYHVVKLHRDGKRLPMFVHRLVLEAFVGPCPEGMMVCHYPDHSKVNNNLQNLRWDTMKENAKDNYRDRPPVTEKRCGDCGMVKTREEFYGDPCASDGLRSKCKRCHNRKRLSRAKKV